eukprot:CAMPEP_0114387966 /NCGR_PEP_ID=MMETSP0102-20121206/7622_1 /TAXON_ID=38822 ORGANISM="Pteridomonas danica, Strain PT" /NCGR_SAMPLE_ID=MMETSP0102 /ASSEMBLY_ACC=CAM_ASM_000212 /LENGTH=69 /DNA_ID=CAMNT_0001545265 /DNA_START=137 /DNA_END=346 /DNA_ORIENTATION=-
MVRSTNSTALEGISNDDEDDDDDDDDDVNNEVGGGGGGGGLWSIIVRSTRSGFVRSTGSKEKEELVEKK